MNIDARKHILNNNTKIVSFDVFDTLLVRPVLEPVDLFYIVEKKVQQFLKDSNFPFIQIRRSSEAQARKRMRLSAPHYEDINIDEIYDVFVEITGLSEDQIEVIKKTELETEFKYLSPRKDILPLYELAVKLGKKVIIASDVYFPSEFLVDVLSKNGFINIENYFVSSELRIAKGSGNLFKHIINELNVRPTEIVHIGDNEYADCKRAIQSGINAVHVPKVSLDFLQGKKVDSSIWNNKVNRLEPSMRILLGFIINKHFSTTPPGGWDSKSYFNGNVYLLGYVGVGPMMLNMVRWIFSKSRFDNIDTLAFIARDGYVPLKVFSILAPLYKNVPEPLYLRMSRSTCINYQTVSKADAFCATSNVAFNRNSPVSQILERRFKLEINEEMEKHFLSWGIDISKPLLNDDEFKLACLDLGEELLSGLNEQRELFEEYYKSIFKGKGKVGLFDVGYSARAQKVLASFLDNDLVGYYFSSFDEVLKLDGMGFNYRNFFNNPQNRWIKHIGFSTALIELFFSECNEGSLTGFTKTKDKIRLETADVEFSEPSIAKVAALHSGITDFVRDVVVTFKEDLHLFDISAASSANTISEFMINPHPRDASIFKEFKFGSYATGHDDNMIIAGNLDNSYWKEGFENLKNKKKS